MVRKVKVGLCKGHLGHIDRQGGEVAGSCECGWEMIRSCTMYVPHLWLARKSRIEVGRGIDSSQAMDGMLKCRSSIVSP